MLVVAGTYGRQLLPAGSKQVTIQAAPGATPVLGQTTVLASNVTLSGFQIVRSSDPGTEATLEAEGANNRYENIDVDSRNVPGRQGIYAHGDNSLFRGGSSFNVVDEKAAWVSGSSITFDNMDFYDVLVTNSSVHNECVYSLGPNLTVRNSRFWNCATFDLFITRGSWYNQPLYGNVTLENNVFGVSRMPGGSPHYYGLGINSPVLLEMRNWRVVNNTFAQPVGGSGIPAPGTIWANNLGRWETFPGATYQNNVGTSIGATDTAASLDTIRAGWIDPNNENFHLKPGSIAIDKADPTYATPTDKDGNTRTGPPDAGAYEYRP